MNTNTIDFLTIKRSLIHSQGHTIDCNTVFTTHAGNNKITGAIVSSGCMDVFFPQPDVLTVSKAVAPIWSKYHNSSSTYAMLEVTSPRGAGVHLLPIERLAELHMIAAQVAEGRLHCSHFPTESKMLNSLASRIMSLHAVAPDSNGYVVPQDQQEVYHHLEDKYLRLLESSSGSLSHSTASLPVFTNLHVAFPPFFLGKGRVLCPSTFLEVACIPAKTPSEKICRMKIVNTELAYDDGLLSGDPCHPGSFGSIISANISARKLLEVIDHLVISNPETSIPIDELFSAEEFE